METTRNSAHETPEQSREEATLIIQDRMEESCKQPVETCDEKDEDLNEASQGRTDSSTDSDSIEASQKVKPISFDDTEKDRDSMEESQTVEAITCVDTEKATNLEMLPQLQKEVLMKNCATIPEDSYAIVSSEAEKEEWKDMLSDAMQAIYHNDEKDPSLQKVSFDNRTCASGGDEEEQTSVPGAFPIEGIDSVVRRSVDNGWGRRSDTGSQPGAFSISSRASGERPAWSQGRENDHSGEFSMAASSLAPSMAVSSLNSQNRTPYDDIEQILIEAEPVNEAERIYATAKTDPWWRRNQAWLAAAAVLIITGAVLAVVLPSLDLSEPEAPTPVPTTLEEGIQASIREIVLSRYPQTNFSDLSSAQTQTIEWVAVMKQQDQDWYTDERTLRQYSLVKFFLSASKGNKEIHSWFKRDGWMESNNECEWYGIKCDDSGYILSVELPNNNLDGTIIPELSLISERLLTLDFSNNNLSGPIPEEVGKLKALKYLDLTNNALTGSISSSIGYATSLETLNLSNNQLNSVIPTTIGGLSSLRSIDLRNNELMGSIPSEIGTLDSIREIFCQNNRLTYELPSEIGNLETLEELNLHGNALLGPLPAELGLLTTLRDLDLSKNHIFYQIPVELYRNGALASLESLDLSDNLLSGTLYERKGVYDFGASWQKLRTLRLHGNYFKQELPALSADLYSIPGLEVLDLSSNYLTGTLSAGIQKLSTITMLDLSNNQFEGELPEVLMKLDGLNTLNLSQNKFRGGLSSNIRKLSALDVLHLSGSGISGSLPFELGSLSLLKTLHLSQNPKLEGTVPTEIGQLTHLESLDLSSNDRMSGTLPTEFGELINLEYLDLSENKFTGSIPNEYGRLTALTTLRMVTNLLNSTIPEIFANFTKLQDLRLADNKLSGSFPNSFAELSTLQTLRIGGNLLKGTIPSEIGLLKNLTYLGLWTNTFTGSIPSEIGNLRDLEYLTLTSNPFSGTLPSELTNLSSLETLLLKSTRLSGSIPSSLCENTPTPDIRVDCEEVACSCPSCRCAGVQDAGVQDTPTKTPTAMPVTQEPTMSPTGLLPQDSDPCGTFDSISESGSVLEMPDEGDIHIDLPFSFNWGGSKNFSHIDLDNMATIIMGHRTDDCYQGITPNLFLFNFASLMLTGPIYFLSSESSVIISWEEVRVDDSSNDPYYLNFQAVLHANGNFEFRWGEGTYSDMYQFLSGASDTCGENMRVGATGFPFVGRITGGGQWPANQCRLFVPKEGFYEEKR